MKRLMIAAILLALSVFAAAPVHAHAVLLATSPADREALAESPSLITLDFNEPVRPIAVRLLDENGAPVAPEAALETQGGQVRLTLRAPLAEGAYLLSYRVTSEDSHPVAGAILFAVGPEPAAWRAPPAPRDNPLWAVAAAANRALHLAGLIGLAGGLACLLLFPGERVAERRSLRPLLDACAGLAALTALAAIGLQGALLANAAPGDLFAASVWRLGLASTRGTAALTALAAAALLFAAARLGARKNRPNLFAPLALAGIAGAVATFALSGHAATAQPRWLAIPALLAHVAVAGLWLGSLAPLLRAILWTNKGAPDRLADFSRAMSFALPAMILGGAALAALQLQALAAIASTRYGVILAIKLALVGLLLAFAAHNKFRLTPALRRGESGVAARLARAIRWEIALGCAILAVTALLSQTPPPRALAAHDGHDHAGPLAGYATVASARGRLAVITLDPARAGRNRIEVRFSDQSGLPFAPLEAVLELSHEMAGVEPLTRPMRNLGGGRFELTGPELAIAGAWRLRIDALISDYEKIGFAASIPVAR